MLPDHDLIYYDIMPLHLTPVFYSVEAYRIEITLFYLCTIQEAHKFLQATAECNLSLIIIFNTKISPFPCVNLRILNSALLARVKLSSLRK